MNKRKIITTASAVALAAAMAFGGTLAYYQGQAETPVENTLVDQGNSVTISETDENGDTTQSNTYSIIPGTTDKKDPVVTAVYTLDSYVYVKADDTTNGWIEWAIANGWTKLGDGYDGVYYMLLKTVQYDSETWTDNSYTDSETNLTYSYNSDSGVYTVANSGGTTLYTYTVETNSNGIEVYTASIPVILNDTVTYSSEITNDTFDGYGSTVSLDFTAYIIQASLTNGTDGDDDYGEKEYASPEQAYYYADPDGYYESAVANGNVAAINETLYSTVESAVSAASDGETVTLLKDVTLDSAVTISGDITFDLAGSTLTNSSSSVVNVTGDVTLTDSSDDSSGSISGGNSNGVVSVAANANLTMESGTITGESSTATTGYGVKLAGSATFTMNGGTIEDCKSYGVYVNSSSSNGGSTFIMNGGTISGNKGGVYVKGQSNSVQSTFTMNDGTISGNTTKGSSSNTGGGVTVHNATFTMNGGTITGNTHTGAAGGGVYVNANGTFTMNEGTISNNTGSNGGGVYLGAATSAFTMNGGSITGNTANTSGGGVHTGSNANTFTMTGGSITENKAGSYGGGVFIGNSGVDFNVSGSPVISNNTVSSSANNVYLLKNAEITLTGELSSEASIGVTVPSNSTFPVQITAAESETTYYTGAANCIKSDSGSYTVQSNMGGYLELTNTQD